MSNEILDEVYAAREWLWNLGGGTMHGVCEFLMECRRRANQRGVKWLDSKEELEAIGAEVRARLAREAAEGEWKDATAVGEERARWKECTMQNAECTMGEGDNDPTILRHNDPTMQRSNEPTSDEVTR